jgi:hypothetical protein
VRRYRSRGILCAMRSTVEHLRALAVGGSLGRKTTLRKVIDRVGFVQYDPVRPARLARKTSSSTNASPGYRMALIARKPTRKAAGHSRDQPAGTLDATNQPQRVTRTQPSGHYALSWCRLRSESKGCFSLR